MTLEPLVTASPVIQVHAYAAIAAFMLGAYVLFGRKGDVRHKRLGRIWVALMVLVALTSFFIWTIRMIGPFSPIHVLSVLTLAGLWRAVGHARARRIIAHRRTMQSLYLGALIIAGFFTFMPGRIMYEVLFGHDGAGAADWAIFLAAFTAIMGAGYLLLRHRLGWRLPRIGRAA